jgi:hypothetical protein
MMLWGYSRAIRVSYQGSCQTDYNYRQVHGSLGVTPIDRWAVLEELLPSWDDVLAAFDLKMELYYVEQLTLKRQYAAALKK